MLKGVLVKQLFIFCQLKVIVFVGQLRVVDPLGDVTFRPLITILPKMTF